MKRIHSSLIVLLLIFVTVDALDAQRRSRSRRNTTQEEQLSFADRINYEIRIGSLAFGSGFSMGVKPSIGYKLNETFTLGGTMRVDYEFVNNFSFRDFSLFNYGPGLLARAKVMDKYYIQGEYSFFSFENIDISSLEKFRVNRNFPSLGVGMVQGGKNWKYNIELMLILDDISRDIFGRTIDFWFSFSKNF